MFYKLIRIPARWAIRIYCRYIKVSNPALFQMKGPLLLAVNHPNSFLDAIILCTLFDTPVHSLARGDAFRNLLAAKILTALNMLPVYRVREGVENLDGNYKTFDACLELFKKNGTVLIFSEGLCENEWHLRPLKKGTARLAAAAWAAQIPLKILPIGINYSSFRLFGKNVHIKVGKPIESSDIKNGHTESGLLLNEITMAIQYQLTRLVYEIPLQDREQQARIFALQVPVFKKIVLMIPAMAGIILNAPFYLVVKSIIYKKAIGSGHYDSMMVGLLLIGYPFYLSLTCVGLYFLTHNCWWLLLFPLGPLTAWCYVQLKKQTDS